MEPASATSKATTLTCVISSSPDELSPGFVVSHEISLDEAPDAYTKFDRREEGYTKVIIHP